MSDSALTRAERAARRGAAPAWQRELADAPDAILTGAGRRGRAERAAAAAAEAERVALAAAAQREAEMLAAAAAEREAEQAHNAQRRAAKRQRKEDQRVQRREDAVRHRGEARERARRVDAAFDNGAADRAEAVQARRAQRRAAAAAAHEAAQAEERREAQHQQQLELEERVAEQLPSRSATPQPTVSGGEAAPGFGNSEGRTRSEIGGSSDGVEPDRHAPPAAARPQPQRSSQPPAAQRPPAPARGGGAESVISPNMQLALLQSLRPQERAREGGAGQPVVAPAAQVPPRACLAPLFFSLQ